MTRRILLLTAVALASVGAGAAVASPATPSPAAKPAATAPSGERAALAREHASRKVRGGLDEWARPSARRLAARWPGLATADLSRDATRGDLDRALSILTGRERTSPNPAGRATAWTTNLLFVRALGLEAERRALMRLATADGARLRMPRHAGSEILARELGLVYNRLSHEDGRERSRNESVRLADVVYALDRASGVGSWQTARLRRYRQIALPAMSPKQLAVAQAALWQVGQPYIWGGDWPGARSPWGAQAHGGFDCSGLIWWAFKGRTTASQMAVGTGLRGRTADAMAWERPAERVAITGLQPGDLVFFGSGGPAARTGTIEHAGIALGDGWMVHSSGSRGGVSLSHLDDYWPSATAFGRRVSQLL
ncbi:NlpC/P60 family protein [Miltoncostaea marina]|uniref:NlpC/P60 family protein n=1 Tax=Miltoncostaea marina TaxID=2843215 RepID=UPI001C3CD62F|nr:NlpC/P60 family protein [Miltoncostaea marina]